MMSENDLENAKGQPAQPAATVDANATSETAEVTVETKETASDAAYAAAETADAVETAGETTASSDHPDHPENASAETEEVPNITSEAPQQEQTSKSPEAPVASQVTASLVTLESLDSKMADLLEKFELKLQYDEHKDTVIDRQAQELEAYRRGLLEKTRLQIVNDLILHIDDLEKLHKGNENLGKQENADFQALFSKILRLFLSESEELRDILEKHGVFAYRSEPGTPFDPKTQRSIKTVPTANPEEDKCIQESLRWGFQTDEKVLRPEWVCTWIYKPQDSKPQENQ